MGEQIESTKSESKIREWARNNLTAEQARKVMQSTLEFAGKVGKKGSELVARLRNQQSPEMMLKVIDESLVSNKSHSEPLIARSEELYKTIATRKKVYQTAPAARKRLLELELRNLMAEYKGVERELAAFFDNEHALNVTRGRLLELMAHGMRQLDEATIDRLVDDVAEVVDEAEAVRDSVRDLDKVGKRRTRESDQESFAAELAGFEEFDDDFAVEPAADEQVASGAAAISSELLEATTAKGSNELALPEEPL